MKLPKVLVIDDERYWDLTRRRFLCRSLGLKDFTDPVTESSPSNANYVASVVFAPAQTLQKGILRNDPTQALLAIRQHWSEDSPERLAVIMLDLRFSSGAVTWPAQRPHENAKLPTTIEDSFGLTILKSMAKEWHESGSQVCNLPVVALSNRPRGELETELASFGNLGYIERTDGEEFKSSFVRHLLDFGLIEDIRILTTNQRDFVPKERTDRIVGDSLPLLRTLREARNIARSGSSSLLRGPNGVPKGQFARYMHDYSPAADHPFDSLDCAASDVGDKLFSLKHGTLHKRARGTVHLDNLPSLPSRFQMQLLDYLIEQKAAFKSPTGTRIFASSSVDEELASPTKMQPQLLSALSEFVLDVPSLRQRKNDIPALFFRYLESAPHASGYKGKASLLKDVAPEAIDWLKHYEWRFNEQGLRFVAHCAAVRSGLSHVIGPAHLPKNQEIERGMPLSSQFGDTTNAEQLLAASKEIERLKSELAESSTELGRLRKLANVSECLRQIEIPKDLETLSGIIDSLLDSFEGLVGKIIGTALVVKSGGASQIKERPEKNSDQEVIQIYEPSCTIGDAIKIVSPKWCEGHNAGGTSGNDYADRLERLKAVIQGEPMGRKGTSNRTRPRQIVHNFLVRVMPSSSANRVELAPTGKRRR